jgi:preprotein translocase subunit SecF
MYKSFLSSVFLFVSIVSFAQPQPTLQQKLQSNLPIQSQFQVLLNQSRNQDADFKIIRKSNIDIIQRNVSDSIAKYTKEIASLKANSSSSVQQVQSLKDSVQTLSESLRVEQEKTDSISFLGIDFSKPSYHMLVWSIIAILGLAFFIIIFSFRKAKVDAVEHQKTAEEVQNDFQAYKKKAMETEQKLKRQLLDEQMKRES